MNPITERGYRVIAIEPSSTMRGQAIDRPDVRWLSAKAFSRKEYTTFHRWI
ncbi:MAG: hypothetical protein QNJ41_05125 [Xenococcaceae cyanobacterium MO_188.B32]|nr:hypothetical protein [Xenococcaceae cyanobacterium MO_188.B32]